MTDMYQEALGELGAVFRHINGRNVDAAVKIIAGTARSMGVEVEA